MKPAFSLLFSQPEDEGRGVRRRERERERERKRERERPIKMPPSFSLHSSLVSPHEFIWWQTIPTPPPVCAHTHTHSCISSIKMIHREAPRRWHFSKWGMMPVKNSHQWFCACRRHLCPLIQACRFSLSSECVCVREVSALILGSLFILLSPLTFLRTLPLPRPSHWSLSLAYLYSPH